MKFLELMEAPVQEETVEEKARRLVHNKKKFDYALNLVEDNKKEELKSLLGPDFDQIIETAYGAITNYKKAFESEDF